MSRCRLRFWMMSWLLFALARSAAAQNVVLIIADDVGADRIGAYGINPTVGPTPSIDGLAAQGVLFRNAWAQPSCSPTRASLLTGLTATEHRIGLPVDPFDVNQADSGVGLNEDIWTLPDALALAGYRNEAFGKWHLVGQPLPIDRLHPNNMGFDHFAGFLYGGTDYFSWGKTVDGVNFQSTSYMTTDTTDDAIAALGGSEPFFLWVAYLASHTPYHNPPQHLHSFDLNGVPVAGNASLYHSAMTEAMDSEIGRLLAAVDLSDTTVIFIGDNGTQSDAIDPPIPPGHHKLTVYEGGVRVPLIFAGEAVAPAAQGLESMALVHATDMFATISELAGDLGPVPSSSISAAAYLTNPALPSTRDTLFAQRFEANGGPIVPATYHRATRDSRYKLIRKPGFVVEFYDLLTDPYELSPLDVSNLTPQQQERFEALDALMTALTTPAIPALNGRSTALLVIVLASAAVGSLKVYQKRRAEPA